MSRGKTLTIWAAVIFGMAAIVVLVMHRRQPVTLRGAVLQQDPDPNKQLPLANVEITATNALGEGHSVSNAAGYFTLTLPKGLRRRQPVLLQFRHQDYRPLDWDDFISDKVYVARMVPNHPETAAPTKQHPESMISNTRIRYSVKATTEADIGTAVKTFQVVNTGNVRCNKQLPCSPDGKWKANFGSLSLDAGEGNEFRNARVACIAGPCPFTRVEQESPTQERRHFNIVVRNWSDTTTFLVEAEVVRPMANDMVRETYPVIFGRALNFSLPASAEGPSIEAEVDGTAIVFPLGPELLLRWADCHVGIDRDLSRTYRCELKPGFQFR